MYVVKPTQNVDMLLHMCMPTNRSKQFKFHTLRSFRRANGLAYHNYQKTACLYCT